MFVHLSEMSGGRCQLYSSELPRGDDKWTDLGIVTNSRKDAYEKALDLCATNKDYQVCPTCCYPESKG